MKLTSKEKKELRLLQIKLGFTSPKRRDAIWQYLLKGELGIGYADAKQIQAMGFNILKPIAYFEDQPN